jgi:signal transduction histidine kinase
MQRLTFLAGALAAGALTAAALTLAANHPDESLANGSGGALTVEAITAALLIAWGVLGRPRRAGGLLLVTTVAFVAQTLPLPDAGGAFLFTLALVLGAAAAALGTLSALELDAEVSWPLHASAVLTSAVCVLWVGVIPTLLFDPSAAGCFACPRNVLLVQGSTGLRTDVVRSGSYVAAGLSAALAVWLFATAISRRSLYWSARGARLGAAIALAASAFVFWHQLAASVATLDRQVRIAWLVECAGLALIAAAPLAEIFRARLERARIVDAVLRTVPTPEELRVTFAASASDRTLALVFPHADNTVDGRGDPAPTLRNGTVVTNVARGGEVVAQLRHESLGGQAARRLADAVHAAGLALEHTSARARLRAQLVDLTSSRARIVEVADAERRRLERNLHDGAQQRLIALSVALATPGDPTATEARDEVRAALDELRAIAHGIHPVSLSDGGIVASVRELADTSAVPLRLELHRVDRLPEPLEAAAYRVLADCVHTAERRGNGQPVSIGLSMTDTGVRAEVRLPGVTREAAEHGLIHAIDRVATASGHVGIAEGTDGAVVELRL